MSTTPRRDAINAKIEAYRATSRRQPFASSALQGGRIILAGTIDGRLETEVRRCIEHCHRMGAGLRIDIHSPGGQVAPARAIATDVEQYGRPTEARVDRFCASAAVDVLMAARERIAGPAATFVLHRTGFAPDDIRGAHLTANDLRDLAAGLESQDAAMVRRLEARTRFTRAQIAALRRGDLLLNSFDAYMAGLVTKLSDGTEGLSREQKARLFGGNA